MGTPPVMVDIMPKISGVEFEEAWKRRVDVRIDDELSVPFISREDLLVAKLSAGRAQDLIDVDALRESSQGEIERQQHPTPFVTSARDVSPGRILGVPKIALPRGIKKQSPRIYPAVRTKGLDDDLN